MTVIQELCNQLLIEDKQKIQAQLVDILALAIEQSQEQLKTFNYIVRGFGLSHTFKKIDEALSLNSTNKEQAHIKAIAERFMRGNLPYINEEGIVEFMPAGSSTTTAS